MREHQGVLAVWREQFLSVCRPQWRSENEAVFADVSSKMHIERVWTEPSQRKKYYYLLLNTSVQSISVRTSSNARYFDNDAGCYHP